MKNKSNKQPTLKEVYSAYFTGLDTDAKTAVATAVNHDTHPEVIAAIALMGGKAVEFTNALVDKDNAKAISIAGMNKNEYKKYVLSNLASAPLDSSTESSHELAEMQDMVDHLQSMINSLHKLEGAK